MIANHRGEVPVVILIIPFIAGIVFNLTYPDTNTGILIVLIFAFSILYIGLRLTYQKSVVSPIRWLGVPLAGMILFLLGWLITARHNDLNKSNYFSEKKADYLIAVINSEPNLKNGLIRFSADVKQTVYHKKAEQVIGTILITIKDVSAKNLLYGDELLIQAKYAPVDPPFNPAEFNYKAYLAHHNIYHQAYLYPKQYVIINTSKGNPIISYALRWRQSLIEKLKVNMRDTTAAAVASTLILGYRADLSNDVLQAYSKTGTIHILSVSGGHVAIIYLLLSWALGFLDNYNKGRIYKAILIIAFIWAYSLLTGFSPAVCRAAVMLSLIVSGKTFNKYINTLNILAVSAFALLLYDPFLISDAGFQLSYLAVAGLIIFQPAIYNWFSSNNKIVKKIWLACSVSLAAQAITFPLSIYYFHQFPLYFLVSNLLIIIPVGIILYTGIALLLLPDMAWLSKPLGFIIQESILLMNKMLAFIENIPYASIGKIWLNNFEYLLLYIITGLFFYAVFYKKAVLFKAALVCTLFLSISTTIKRLKGRTTTSVMFLNLRKHNGIIFKNGEQGIVLTDLPESDKNFQYAIQPCLDSSRITDYKVYPVNANLRLPYLFKQNNQIRFLKYKLILLNPDVQNMSIQQPFNANFVYVANNAFADTTISRCGMLVIAGSNTDKHVGLLTQTAKKFKIRYMILKRNNAVTITSN